MSKLPLAGRIIGWLIHGAIGAMVLMAGSGKAFGFAPAQVTESLTKIGLIDQIHLLGWGELLTAILLLIPRTMPIGAFLMCGFWGGVICIHMAHHEAYLPWAVALALTGIGAWLRDPRIFASLAGPPRTAVPVAHLAEAR